MKRHSKLFICIIVIVLISIIYVPIGLAETEEPTATPTSTSTPTDTPTPTPTPSPTPTPTPTPTKTAKPTVEPTKTIPPETQTPEPTPTPDDTPTPQPVGRINLSIFVYHDNVPASGYKVQIGNSSLTADSSGNAGFPQVTVESHDLKVIAPNGDVSTAVLRMVSGGKTGIKGDSKGTFDISVADNAQVVYLNTNFVAGKSLDIISATETQPEPPVAPTKLPAGTFPITADFVDSAGKEMPGLGVHIQRDNEQPLTGMADRSGRYTVNAGGFGQYYWAMAELAQIENASVLGIEIIEGTKTSIVSSGEKGYQVETPSTTQQLYFKFKQTNGGFILEEVSDKVPSAGISSLMIGIIAVVVIVIAVIVIINIIRKKNKKTKNSKTIKPYNTTSHTSFEEEEGSDESSAEGEAPNNTSVRKTGGANKFSDRSKL